MSRDFIVVLRGYEPAEVDHMLDQVDAAVASGDETARAAARGLLQEADFTVALRGYDRGQVDEAVRRSRSELGDGEAIRPPGVPRPETLTVVLRGYDRAQVDSVLEAADAALAADNEFARAAARDALGGAEFATSWRGYDRRQVDKAVEQRLIRLG